MKKLYLQIYKFIFYEKLFMQLYIFYYKRLKCRPKRLKCRPQKVKMSTFIYLSE